MPNQDWENLKETFHATLALPAEKRTDYLDRVCNGDVSMRKAIESLLQAADQTGFVDEPAYKAAAEMLLGDEKFTAGETIGRYRIVSLLGQGGMGEVYLAEDTKLNRRVAIKFLPRDLRSNEEAKRRLLREAQAAAKLDHPNICAVHEVAEDDGRNFIVMPYVEGELLNHRNRRKPFEVLEALTLAIQFADALAEAHSHGIIHRDIKPSNIIINLRGQAKVMDFGLAKQVSGVSTGIDPEASTQEFLTTPGAIIGTVPYMSPEQVHGQILDARTDIFSFGVVLYEMLTGQQVFAADSAAGTISAILTKDPPPLHHYLKSYPDELQRVVSKCLEKDRERRYHSMSEVVTDIESVRSGYENKTLAVSSGANSRATASWTSNDVITKRPSFLRANLKPVLVVVALLAIVTSAYALFFRNRVVSPAGGVTSMDSGAYDYYLRGKLDATSENKQRNENAIRILEDVVKQNPSFAPAYADLARAYGIKANYFAPEPEQEKLNNDAKLFVEKSLALEPNLAEGHFVRGFLLWTHANRFPHDVAIQSDKRAITLDPNLGPAHHHLGVMYFHIGLLDKAEEHLKRALEINPSDTLARFRLGSINVCRGKYEEALSILKTVPREAHAAIVDRATADALLHLGRMEEASDIVEDYLKANSTDEGGNVTSIKAVLLAKAGNEKEAEETIQRAIDIGKAFQHFHHTTYNIAAAYALLNKPNEALKWLRFTADDGFPCYPLFEGDANFNSLRKDERFISFMSQQRAQWERFKATL